MSIEDDDTEHRTNSFVTTTLIPWLCELWQRHPLPVESPAALLAAATPPQRSWVWLLLSPLFSLWTVKNIIMAIWFTLVFSFCHPELVALLLHRLRAYWKKYGLVQRNHTGSRRTEPCGLGSSFTSAASSLTNSSSSTAGSKPPPLSSSENASAAAASLKGLPYGLSRLPNCGPLKSLTKRLRDHMAQLDEWEFQRWHEQVTRVNRSIRRCRRPSFEYYLDEKDNTAYFVPVAAADEEQDDIRTIRLQNLQTVMVDMSSSQRTMNTSNTLTRRLSLLSMSSTSSPPNSPYVKPSPPSLLQHRQNSLKTVSTTTTTTTSNTPKKTRSTFRWPEMMTSPKPTRGGQRRPWLRTPSLKRSSILSSTSRQPQQIPAELQRISLLNA